MFPATKYSSSGESILSIRPLVFLYLFIPILYMFRATKCSSSGESTVSIRPLGFLYLFIPVLYMFPATKCSSSGESVISIRPLVFLYLFIQILYMFPATKCSSSGQSTVSTRPLVYITVCRWPCGMQVWRELSSIWACIPHGLDGNPSIPAYHTVTYIQWHIPEVVLIQFTLLMMCTWLLETCRELE
jgi:hypothetical protein